MFINYHFHFMCLLTKGFDLATVRKDNGIKGGCLRALETTEVVCQVLEIL